jgi:N-acetylneuraminic acid mutarotase
MGVVAQGWLRPLVVIAMAAATATIAIDHLALSQAPPPEGTWQTLAPAPTRRTEGSAATVGGKIYVVGGLTEPPLGNLMNPVVSDLVQAYDPATDSWTSQSPLPRPLHHVGIATVGNDLYVVGGFTSSLLNIWKPSAQAFRFNPDLNRWAEIPPMPTARGALAMAELGGKLFAIGGYDGVADSAAVEVFDPSSNTWSTRPSLPTPRDHLTVAVSRSRLYAIGGRLNRDPAENLSVVEVYDPFINQWSKVAGLPTARSGIAAGVIQGQIYVVGGESPRGTFRETEAYNPETDKWITMAPMPTKRHGLGVAVLSGRLYTLSGGPQPGATFSDVNEVFTPPTQQTVSFETRRASAKHVGTIMAMLATFQDAGVLPPETTPEANRLIHAIIQYQVAFMKSGSPAVKHYLTSALSAKMGDGGPQAAEQFHKEGWTSRSLEAVVEFAAARPPWERADLMEAFREFNVSRPDFELLSQTYVKARSQLSVRGQNIHAVYGTRRKEMPGGRTREERYQRAE